ncbi:GNAT family N-acetyltransferase [Myxococcota bacterium]|nr:GNAT family N-acetyltransferase [Myxococcota bacterium]MBU1432550.1 GNAT family N-acetyltransferase [Myxococcota bacterium]MBU1898839.1 GNAT family N-acetyltransferase [Myxococcota bacterium]
MVSISVVKDAAQMARCLFIRHHVFVIGQGVPINREVDGLDDLCRHYIVLVDGVPVGTARYFFANGYIKLQRVAVLEEYRGQGISKKLLEYMIQDAIAHQWFPIRLDSQVYIEGLYQKLGFVRRSNAVFMDAGLPHVTMEMSAPPGLKV